MTALAKPKTASALHDIGRDWRRWSTTERCSGVAIALTSIALPVAILIALHSV